MRMMREKAVIADSLNRYLVYIEQSEPELTRHTPVLNGRF